MASSTLLLGLYANCKGSWKFSKTLRSSFRTNRSKHFMGTDVRATGRKSFISLTLGFLGMGMISEHFQDSGMEWFFNDRLKINVYIKVNCSEHIFNTLLLTPSGPQAFLLLRELNSRETCSSVTKTCVASVLSVLCKHLLCLL